jgi:hypothetical protein
MVKMYRFGRGWTLLFEDVIPVLIPVAARSKTWVFGRSLAEVGVSNTGGMDVRLL